MSLPIIIIGFHGEVGASGWPLKALNKRVGPSCASAPCMKCPVQKVPCNKDPAYFIPPICSSLPIHLRKADSCSCIRLHVVHPTTTVPPTNSDTCIYKHGLTDSLMPAMSCIPSGSYGYAVPRGADIGRRLPLVFFFFSFFFRNGSKPMVGSVSEQLGPYLGPSATAQDQWCSTVRQPTRTSRHHPPPFLHSRAP